MHERRGGKRGMYGRPPRGEEIREVCGGGRRRRRGRERGPQRVYMFSN